MDLESARRANLLVGNDAGAPVLELLFTGAKFLVLTSSELAIAGAEVECDWPTWRNFRVEAGAARSLLGHFVPGCGVIWQSGVASRLRDGSGARVRIRAQALARPSSPALGWHAKTGCRLKRSLHVLCRSWCARNTDKLPSFRFGAVPSGTALTTKREVNS